MTTTSNKGKFSEKKKRICLFRKKNVINEDNNNHELYDLSNVYMNFLKVTAAIPGLVYSNLVTNDSLEKPNKKKVTKNDNGNNYNTKNDAIDENRKIKRKIINDIDLNEIKNSQINFNNNKDNTKIVDNKRNWSSSNDIDKAKRVKELEKSIINLIKKDLIRIVNEMELLQSELYILSEVNGENKTLKDCRRELDQVKNILCKIDKLKEQYDFLKDNYDFEYMLEINNNDIVDKIIELRDMFGNNELKALSEDYKLLDVYKYLYLKLDDLQEKTTTFSEKKKQEELKLKDRDIDFEKLKNDVYNVDFVNRNYQSFVNNQNELLREIDNSVSKINSYEQVDLQLKGFNALFINCFKYFGLLMVSPLKGIIPSIATETIITGNLIKNLYNNLEWEEKRKMVYEAIDYSSIINNAINDLDNTSRIVDSTLDDIVHLKMQYNEKFKQYQGDFLQYREIMHKINDMENKILGNKIKIEMMKKRTLDQKRVNEKKLVLVKELNEKESHN